MIFVYLLFFGLVIGLAVLPTVPAILEWRRPTDTAPLRVVQRSEVDVRHLATGFRTWVTRALAEPLAASRRTGAVQEGESGGTRFTVVPNGNQSFLGGTDAKAAPFDRVLVSCGDLRIPDNLTLTAEVYAEGSVVGGTGAVCRAILAGGDIALGAGSRTLRWLHADGSVYLGANSVSHGRASAGREIVLGPNVGFERVNASRVVFGSAEPEVPRSARELPVLETAQLQGGVVMETDAGRWLIKGDVTIPADTRVETNLVVTGRCVLRHGVVVAGDVKSHGDLVLERDVAILGSLVSGRDIILGGGCRIDGPVVAERAVEVAAGTVIGGPDRPTTVTASELNAAVGVIAHGTVWAHRRGRVVPVAAETPTTSNGTAP